MKSQRGRGLAVLLSLSILFLLGADWPRFRGPNGSGISQERDLPVVWNDDQTIAWKTKLPGPGSSSPITWGDFVFVTCFTGYTNGSDPQENLRRHLICIRRGDGSIQWQKDVAPVLPEDPYSGFLRHHGYASSTPVTDGERIYVFFGKTGVLAFDFAGNQLWQTSVGTDSSMRGWGSAASPVLYKNMVIVNANAEDESIVALDKTTGQEVWKANAGGAYGSWSTPVQVQNKAGETELIFSVPYEVWSLNPENGKLSWYVEATGRAPVNPSPVVHDDIIYVVGSRDGGCIAIRSGGKGDATDENVLWTSRANSYVPSPVIHEGLLYLVNDSGVAYCIDTKTGEEVYSERLRGSTGRNGVYASIVLAGNKIYAVTRTNGTFVLAAGPEFKQLAHNTFASDSSDFNASPAISDGQLLLRSNEYLYCVAEQ